MKKLVFLIGAVLLCTLSFNVKAQYYSYAFEGDIRDSVDFDMKLNNIEDIENAKIRIKPGTNTGEILFLLKRDERDYDENGKAIRNNGLVAVKSLLQKEGLIPVQALKIRD